MGLSSPEVRRRSDDKARVQRALYRLEHPLSPRSINKIKKSCIYCGTEFWVFPSLNRVQCCSLKCSAQIKAAVFTGRRLKPSVRPCNVCGIEMEVKKIGTCTSCRNAASLQRYHDKYKHSFTEEQKDNHRRTSRESYKRIMADPSRKMHHRLVAKNIEHCRRAKQNNTRIGRISYTAILSWWGYVCWICRSSIKAGELSFDHVIPLCRDGGHVEENLRPAHIICNVKKNRYLLEEMTWLS